MLSCFFIISGVKWGLLFEIIGALVIQKMLEDSAIPTIKSIKKTLNDKRKNEEN